MVTKQNILDICKNVKVHKLSTYECTNGRKIFSAYPAPKIDIFDSSNIECMIYNMYMAENEHDLSAFKGLTVNGEPIRNHIHTLSKDFEIERIIAIRQREIEDDELYFIYHKDIEQIKELSNIYGINKLTYKMKQEIAKTLIEKYVQSEYDII